MNYWCLSMICALCVLGVHSLQAESKTLVPVVVSVSGKVETKIDGVSSGTAISTGSEIRVSSEIVTADNGEISIGISTGLALTVKNNSKVVVLEAVEETNADGSRTRSGLIEVLEGRVVVLMPEADTAPFHLRIKTPQGIIKPRGTFYALMVQDGRSFLAVSEGKVGLEQFVPITEEDVDKEGEKTAAAPQRSYGSATTTSPRG